MRLYGSIAQRKQQILVRATTFKQYLQTSSTNTLNDDTHIHSLILRSIKLPKLNITLPAS